MRSRGQRRVTHTGIRGEAKERWQYCRAVTGSASDPSHVRRAHDVVSNLVDPRRAGVTKPCPRRRPSGTPNAPLLKPFNRKVVFCLHGCHLPAGLRPRNSSLGGVPGSEESRKTMRGRGKCPGVLGEAVARIPVFGVESRGACVCGGGVLITSLPQTYPNSALQNFRKKMKVIWKWREK